MGSTIAVQTKREPIGTTYRECPLCESRHLEYEFIVDGAPVCACEDCGLLFLNPQPESISPPAGEPAAEPARVGELRIANAEQRIRELMEYSGLRGGTLLAIGDDPHLCAEAERAGFRVIAISAYDFENNPHRQNLPEGIDACILLGALNKMHDPFAALRSIRNLLTPTGTLLVVSPATDSRVARFFRSSWWEFHRANLFYFSTDTLQNLLLRAGFGDPVIAPEDSLVSLNYLRRRLAQSSRRRRYRLLRSLASLSPVWRDKAFRLTSGRTRFFVRPKNRVGPPVLSVVVPVFNERGTVCQLLDQVLAKTIEGVEIEVIIVESNSTDGTRDLVLEYQQRPRVRLVLEETPRGKGYAVRTALKIAKGDVVLFQDADLEYDVNDYDALIEPILRHRANFVLGSRHTSSNSSWKIRTFADSAGLAAYFNIGHALLLAMFNIVYSQNLTDPFTMFKVFRRECLYGLSWECDRFDFDNEIVIKLIRKGYKPLELPVNYQSRSMQEGKKVTLFLDPLRWIRALLKFRHSRLYTEPIGRKQ